MKLLGWMHSKFRQSNGDVLIKDFAGAGGVVCNCLSSGPSTDEYHRQHCTHPKTQRSSLRRPIRDQEGLLFEGELSEHEAGPFLFGGFLTIGTLGSAALNGDGEGLEAAAADVDFSSGPATPGFGVAAEAIAEKEAEATTEEDLAVVSSELEKLLAAEAEKEATAAARASSARPSHASSKAAAGAVGGGGGNGCPLQGYLLGSPVETVGRKERRASLGELFMRNCMAEEAAAEEGSGGGENKEKKAAGVHVMVDRMLKRRGSRRVTGRAGGDGERAFAETKFHKILQIFNRKVHPESTTEDKRPTKSGKKKNKDYIRCNSNDNCDAITRASPKSTCGDQDTKIPSFQCHSIPSMPHGSSESGSREHWIRTDADYLVLEL